MVGFDSTIKSSPNKAASKLTNQTDPFDLSALGAPDLSLPLIDPFPDFTWCDDFIMDSDTIDNILVGETPVLDCSVVKSFDFETPIEEKVVGEGCLGHGFEEKVAKKGLGSGEEGQGLGCLIEKEMEKVSLVGGDGNEGLFDCLPLKEEDGNGANGVSVDVKEVSEELVVLVSADGSECLPELKVEEDGEGANEVLVDFESESRLEVEESGVALGGNTEKVEVVTDKSEAQGKEMESEEEDSDSSDLESESDSSESDSSSSPSSSSDEEEEEEEMKIRGVGEMEEGEIRYLGREDILVESDEDEEGVVKGPIKSKNEIEVLPPVPQVNVTLEPHHQPLPVGVVLSVMGAKVVVEGLEKHNPLNEGSILWLTETRSPLGLVDEIFGPVKNPYYIVRFNSEEEVPAGINGGTPVSFVTEFANYVLSDSNIYKKGYDASGENDEELSDEVEFSDDEKEAEYRRAQKMAKGGNDKKRGNRDSGNQKKVQHKGTSWKSTHPPSQPLHPPMAQPSNAHNMNQPFNSHNMGQPLLGVNMVHPSNSYNMNPPYNTPNMGQPSNGTNMGPPSNNPNMCHQSSNPNQFPTQPLQTTFGSGSFACNFGAGPGSASLPVASQGAQINFCTPQNSVPPNGVWMNGMAYQPQQQMIFPNGFQMNGMPPQQLNQHQHPPQMFTGFPNGMQIQQQFDPSQRQLPNMALPYRQPNFSPGPSTPWQGLMGQAAIDQAQLKMGFQGHPLNDSTSLNARDAGACSNGLSDEQSNEMPPSSNIQGNFSAPHHSNRTSNSTRGRRPYRRGGGNFSGRRGR